MSDSFSDSIRKFTGKVEAAANPGKIPLTELFPREFMVRNTRTANIAAFFQAGGYDVGSQAELEAIDPVAFDEHVRAHSSFQSWHDMKAKAHEEWLQRKLA